MVGAVTDPDVKNSDTMVNLKDTRTMETQDDIRYGEIIETLD
jgi:hypothetical protein